MTRFRRERALLRLAVLITGISCCAAASVAHGADGTGGALMPVVLAPSTGGIGYGDPGTRSLVVGGSLLFGHAVDARGTMPGAAHRQVILQRLDARRGWRNVARARVRSSERFLIRWRADRSGQVSLRAVIAPRRSSDRTSSRAAGKIDRVTAIPAPVVDVTVYRPAMATFYGPGFFGRATACGVTLTPETHGVAHKRLPCGTLVRIMFQGREITVPVIDRGPFNGSYTWDLTQATADALGFQAGDIGYARVAAPAPSAS
ncbi:MAG: rare lipoprotein [Frankiaceae bacterium]|jgi:rare lipoprotein A|nr:rare lipoprotein [Frankiaceae bacterium]